MQDDIVLNALQFGDVSVANGAITMHSDSRAYLLKNNVGSIGQDDFYQVGNITGILSPIPNCIAIPIPTRWQWPMRLASDRANECQFRDLCGNGNLKSAILITLVSMFILHFTAILVVSVAMAATNRPQ